MDGRRTRSMQTWNSIHTEESTLWWNTANPGCLALACASCCIPGRVHMGSGTNSTCKITTSKLMRLERRSKWDIVCTLDWQSPNRCRDVCLALRKYGCKNECSGRCTCKRTDSHAHHYVNACANLDVLFYHVENIVDAVHYGHMLL